MVLHAGTEIADTRYEYKLPAGTYTATNIGAYMTQLDIVAEEVVENSDGVEEQEGILAEVVDADDSISITLEEGQVIEIEEGDSWNFETE